MSGVIKCPNCKTPMFVAEEMIGQVMACPTCQRPIQFVGQSAVASSSSAAPTAPPPLPAVPPVAKSTLPKAAPLAPAAPILPALEPAPAAPKYSAEVSQFALQPVTSAPPPPKPRDETISPAVLITWIVLGLLVVGSGAVVAVASFRGMSHEPVAKLPKSSVPPIPPSQRAFSRPFSAPPKAQQAADDSGAATVVPTLSTTQAEDNETETSDGPESPSAPQPTPKAMPTILPAQQQPRATTGIPGSPVGQETALPAATSVPVGKATPAAASPAAAAPSAPPPPMITGPLAGLDEAWRLPAPISAVEAPLSSLSEDPTEPINVSLSSTAAAIGETAALFAERSESGIWTVFYAADIKQPEAKTPLGTLRLVGRQFSFAWKSLELPELRRQVANCRLTVHHGSQTRTVQLRPIQEEPAVKLDLERATIVREFTIADSPKAELLRLEVASLDGFEGNPSVLVKSLPLAKDTKIEFTDLPGAEIGVRFQKLPAGSLAVRLEPAFHEGESKEFDLTLPRLKAFEDGVTRALRTAERELPAAKRDLAGQQNALRKLQGAQPSNPLLVPAWKQSVNDLAGDVDRTSRKVARLTNDIPLHKARLAAVPKMRDFLTKLHQSATIKLRIVAECGEHDLVLVSASLAAQSAE